MRPMVNQRPIIRYGHALRVAKARVSHSLATKESPTRSKRGKRHSV